MKPSEIQWKRTPEGLRSADGRFELHRHEVDDRADHGVRWTYWNLLVDGVPVDQFNYQRTAKSAVARYA